MSTLSLMEVRGRKMCPSAPAEAGSSLFGVVAGKGQVAYITPNIPVTEGLLAILGQSDIPIENRLRFTGACMEHCCVQWEGAPGSGRCGLIDQALSVFEVEEEAEDLPTCGIRPNCRWFAQHGGRACAACPEVIRRPA